ncbi:hypothetical protein [Phyllobacterium endophyticum]|uniref:Alpha 1,4-glycosyltransferase domain-containing protein n=1 Tax=Phyllobacterium endophyticum TaxID=1149773 RepID=A0A2P7AWI5_9HYPH|nr:hypothetical protein [Phyllobacterium endophyticum]PSH58575.1 hypothetical protein CU100_13430 [Phyllobacterium endophyticum]TYR39257.1 hypothetical protein FY050_25260 [Phyllobacterium endophyticum]
MEICSFWYGSSLRFVDRVCLASMILAGHRVKLFCYDPIGNVPSGVEVHDAEPVLPRHVFARINKDFPAKRPGVTVLQFSDLFRVMLMKHGEGAWLDTDVYLIKPFDPAPAKPYLARENFSRLGVSALYLPPDNPIIGDFDAYINGTEILPDWLGFHRRFIKPALARLKGEEVTTGMIGHTVFGNDGISRLARRHGFFRDAAPKESFYYWTGRDALRIFDAKYGLEPIRHKDFIGFHIHKKQPTDLPAEPGSFYHWAIERVQHLLA